MNNNSEHFLGKAFEGMSIKDIILLASVLVLIGAIGNWLAIKMAQKL